MNSSSLSALNLPILSVLREVEEAVEAFPFTLLKAAPGAGKSTVVPLHLLQTATWLEGSSILMLEPRRLAARAVALRMAELIGEDVGRTVGFSTRLERKISSQTRIEVVTEGILTRRLQNDPELRGIGLVIFDEFHERSLQADLGLALCRDLREVLRPDLRFLLMSATLDMASLQDALGETAVVESEGREYPVETRHLPTDTRTRSTLCGGVAQAVQTALRETSGSLLVFLPGEAEIRQTTARLEGSLPDARTLLHPLFGSLSQDKQKAALEPPPPNHRKVVLATSIAESSLTIEDVSTVIDSGLGRRPVFDPARGMSRLETRKISRASADQRRGRAGRLGPGTCYRLWAEEQDRALVAFDPPEIQTADLTSLVLELAAWGCRTWHDLNWIDPPPSAAFAQAQDLLVQLGALQPDGSITRHGRSMVEAGVAPRYAHMILEARAFEASRTACDLAALLDERDILRRRGQSAPTSDLRHRLELLAEPDQARGTADLDTGALKRCRQASEKLRRQLALPNERNRPDLAGELVALAYPDRVARRRGGAGRYLMRNGRGAELPEDDSLAAEDWVAIAHLDDRPGNAKVFLAAPLSLPRLEALFESDIERRRRVEWSSRENEVLAREEWRLGALVLRTRRLDQVAPDEMVSALLKAVRDKGLAILPWTEDARRLQARLSFMRTQDPENSWPDVGDAALLDSLEHWLAPYLAGAQRLQDLEKLDILRILYSLLDHEQQKRLDNEAPDSIAVPSGAVRRIDYTPEEGPILPVKLQEMFGARETPRIMNGRVPLTLHLLSPAGRPLQVTRNLETFWQDGYRQVRAEMRGRYPKHPWPENPLEAAPTASAKRRGSQ